MGRTVQSPAGMLQKVESALKALGLEGAHLVLAVSGGGDSMALLEAAALLRDSLRLKLTVATLDHGLRSGAAAEVALVERACARLGIPCQVRRLGLVDGPGLEARARTARYAALESVRLSVDADGVATAHTATDQAETLLMRLARGAATGGAVGIHLRRGTIVRPLLTCTREEVRAFLASRDVPSMEDPMNSDPRFLRVRIRGSVLPALEAAAGPGTAERLARFSTFAADDDRLLTEWAEAAYRRVSMPGADALDTVAVRALPAALRRRVLARLLMEAGLAVDAALLGRLEDAVVSGRTRATLPKGRTLLLGGGQLRVESPPPPKARSAGGVDWGCPTLEEGAPPLVLPGAGLALALRGEPSRQPGWVSQALGPLATRLILRTRLPGDRVALRTGRTRKVQDVLVDAGVPRERRDTLPLVIDAETGRVVCIPGIWPLPGTPTGKAAGLWLESREQKCEQAPD